jgi:hypothetical protein
LVAASTSAIMSVGRRPAKKRAITSGDTEKPARPNSCAATVAAIASLSTKTPLQSKMITGGPRIRPPHLAITLLRKVIRVARLWTGSREGKARQPGRSPCAQLLHMHSG